MFTCLGIQQPHRLIPMSSRTGNHSAIRAKHYAFDSIPPPAVNACRCAPVTAFHKSTTLSPYPPLLAIRLPSGLNTKLLALCACPVIVCRCFPVFVFQRCTLPSLQPLASVLPSGWKVRHPTNPLCPASLCCSSRVFEPPHFFDLPQLYFMVNEPDGKPLSLWAER